MTTYAFTIELTDYTFFALKALFESQCKEIEAHTGIVAYDPITGEAKHPIGEVLILLNESASSAKLNSFYQPARG
jgi:hypothetical protein